MYSVYRQVYDVSQYNAVERRIDAIHGYIEFSGSFLVLFDAITLEDCEKVPLASHRRVLRSVHVAHVGVWRVRDRFPQ